MARIPGDNPDVLYSSSSVFHPQIFEVTIREIENGGGKKEGRRREERGEREGERGQRRNGQQFIGTRTDGA
eukprot:410833-Rhodomonas_salina.1